MNIPDAEYLDYLRHSTAHLLAAAVLELYPDAKPTIGPAIDTGFYYDFEFASPLSETDLKDIEKKMKKLSNSWMSFEKHDVTANEARVHFAHNPYKLELIEEIVAKGEQITLYTSGTFTDLCRGGHVESPSKELKHFKLLSLAGAYWRGDEKNTMLTRIYGTAFATAEELDEHLRMLEEAKKRDHRVIGKNLELYFIDEMVGKGLVMWLPNGNIIKEEIESYAKQVEARAGYVRVTTPHIAKEELYLTSGHLPYYKDDMFPGMIMDDGTYYLRGMNCPHHHRIFLHSPKSYRDMPMRIAEYGMDYRNELSGTLAGLLRVRGLTMNDAHIYCRKDQIKEEFKNVMNLVMDYFKVFGFEKYWFRLSKWDPAHIDKYIQEPDNWYFAEQVLREVLIEMNVPFTEADNEAAFYGPKVDVQFTSAIGRVESMSTIQLDFLAKSRFGLTYTDQEGHECNDVFVIHRAPLSVHERFMAFLIELYAGNFPLWLAPVQVALLPVSEKHTDYAQKVHDALQQAGIRTELDLDNKTLPAKIRRWTLQKAPYMCIIGDKEAQSNELAVSVRTCSGEDQGMVTLTSLIDQLRSDIDKKTITR